MEILLWLVPSVVVTVAAMAWAGWAGRTDRREVDREAAVQRLGEALQRDARRVPVAGAPRTPGRDRSTGVAVRPSRLPRTTQPGQRRQAS